MAKILEQVGAFAILLLVIGLPVTGVFYIMYDSEVTADIEVVTEPKTYDLTVKDYSIYCIEGVKYVVYYNRMAPKISKENLRPERCEE